MEARLENKNCVDDEGLLITEDVAVNFVYAEPVMFMHKMFIVYSLHGDDLC